MSHAVCNPPAAVPQVSSRKVGAYESRHRHVVVRAGNASCRARQQHVHHSPERRVEPMPPTKHHNTTNEGLRVLPALRGLDRRELSKLARLVDEVTVDAGEILIREGDVARKAFVIAEGTARVTIGDQLVCELGPGQIVGETAMLEHGPRTASVVAATPVRLLVIGPSDLYSFAGLPPVARAVMSTLLSRLRAADVRIHELATRNVAKTS